MSRSIQTLTLGVALGAAAFAGATFVKQADATRHASVADHSIGFVDVFGLVDQIVMGEEPTAARVAFETSAQERVEALQARNAEIQQIAQANPDSPDTQNLVGEFQQNQQQMQQIFENYQFELQELIASQIADGYKKVYEAVKAVAGETGTSFVFATRPDSNLLQTDSITGVAQEILARPLIAPAASIDLTAQVRTRLGLPEPAADGASPLTAPEDGAASEEAPD